MKCKKCGTEFFEGIFCPECGERYVSSIETEQEKIRAKEMTEQGARLQVEQARLESERLAKEKTEHEAEIEKQKTEQERLANERIQKEVELTKIKMEQARIEKEAQVEKEKIEAEQQRIAREQAEKDRDEKEHKRIEAKRIAEEKKQENEGKVMAILSLVMGILAICTLGALYIPEILGIIFAIHGKKQGVMRKQAKSGLICSIVSIVIFIIIFILALLLP